MLKSELTKILEKHKKWLNSEDGYKRAVNYIDSRELCK